MQHPLAALILVSLFVSDLGAADAPPQKPKRTAIYAARPAYPVDARRRRLTGSGVFAMHVRSDGIVSRVEVIKSTGYAVLDKAAIAAFGKWRFHPGTGPIVRTPIRFTMEGAGY